MKKAFLAVLSVFCLTVGQSTAQNAFGLNTAVKTQKTVQVGDNTYQVEVLYWKSWQRCWLMSILKERK